jgi:4-hydroxybenzoate polyprenyltransferase
MNLKSSSLFNYFSLVKIHHTVFSLPFALIGFFLAATEKGDQINFRLLILVLLCVFFARNAAMGFNRYVDREFDKKNPRTALREVPKEIIKPQSALVFVILNALLFIIATGFLNFVCLMLSPVALFVVLGYSFTKRFTYFSHLFLGLGLALAPIGAYLAVTGQFAILPVLYSFVVILWVAGFDIIYALQDIDFDNSENLKSIPARIGINRALLLSALSHFFSVLLIIIAGLIYPFHWLYWTGTAIFSVLIIYQHLIIKPTDLSKVNMAFFTLNGIASVIYAIFVITDLLT